MIWYDMVLVKLEFQIMNQAFYGMIWDGLACLSTIVMICYDPWYPHDIPMISPLYHHSTILAA